MSGDALGRRVAWVLLTVAMVLSYLAVLDAPFVYDDKIEVVGNTTIRDLEQWRAIARYNVSRPLLVATYALDYHNHALHPRGYHLSNLLVAALALGAALLLAESLLRLFRVEGALPRAVAVAGLWILHPMATEGVTYITGRSESMCALFSFFSLHAWARAQLARRAGEGEGGWRLLGLLSFLGAVGTKEVGAMVPAAALAMELLAGEGSGLRRLQAVRWRWYLPYALLIGLAAWLRLQHAASFLPREVERDLGVQLSTQALSWLRYVQLWLLPWGQTVFHHQPELLPSSAAGLGAILGWLGLVALGLAWGRRVPLAGLALLCGALFLLPSSSVVPLKENLAEHRAFQTGFWILLAIAASLPVRWSRPAAVLAGLLGLGLAGLTQLRHAAWASEGALWEEATRRRPEVADAWYGLGDARRFNGEMTLAQDAFQEAVRLDPGHLDAWNNLGIVRASLGDADGAREAWRAALRHSPSYCKAHSNLGVLAEQERDWDEAFGEFHTTLSYCPENARAHYGLCQIHRGPRRDREKAIFHCQTFVDLAPTSDQAVTVREWLLELTF